MLNTLGFILQTRSDCPWLVWCRRVVTLLSMLLTFLFSDDRESFWSIEDHTGMPASVVPDAYPDARFEATLVKIYPEADRQKATVKVEVRGNSLSRSSPA